MMCEFSYYTASASSLNYDNDSHFTFTNIHCDEAKIAICNPTHTWLQMKPFQLSKVETPLGPHVPLLGGQMNHTHPAYKD